MWYYWRDGQAPPEYGRRQDQRSALHALHDERAGERGSGEGAGYGAYGIYPDYKDYYALHVFFDNIHERKVPIDTRLEKWGTVAHGEQIKTYEQYNIRKVHTLWRYFFRPDRNLMPKSTTPEEDIITHLVMKVNTERSGALIFSSVENLGVFKAAG